MTVRRCYDFGGIPVALSCTSRALGQLLDLRYRPFATAKPAVWRIAYRVNDETPPSPHELADGRKQPLTARRDGTLLRLTAETFRLELDLGTRTGRLDGPLATYPIDHMIQALWYATWRRGLILHGAALVDGDRGWLASGPSGVGKSTLASLFPEQALCDELTAVHLDAVHLNDDPDNYLGDGTPRLGALPFWHSRPGSATLHGIYLLRHGTLDQRRRLGPSEAFARLRPEVIWPTFDPPAMGRAFEALADLIERVPIWELSFRPTRAVWPVLSQEAA